jgi:hypothetical protein
MWWLPNPRFPEEYKDKLEALAFQRGCSVGSLIVNVVLEHVDASFTEDGYVVGALFPRTCTHPQDAPTRVRRSGVRVCWCGAAVTG